MKRIVSLIPIVLLLLTGCLEQTQPVSVLTLDGTALNQTAVMLTTLDSMATEDQQPTLTNTPLNTQTPILTLDRTRPLIQSPTAEIPCNISSAGSPLDITIPDGTVMSPGQAFSKTWRLENVGSCTWTRLYSVTFFSGNPLNAFQTHYLLSEIPPGQVIDITVDMVAPEEPGTYQSNWMLVDPNGDLFGIGPNGDAPFWARIEVIAQATDTPTPSPTRTITPIVFVMGSVDLINGDTFDLDTGLRNSETLEDPDFNYIYGGTPPFVLNTLNGALWAVVGEEEPSLEECQNASLSGDPISFTEVPFGTYLCYQTSELLPGWLLINGFADESLAIRFLTWSMP
jgi:hypothetical protein